MTGHQAEQIIEELLAALDAVPQEALTDDEREAFERAMANPDPGVASEELLDRLRPRP